MCCVCIKCVCVWEGAWSRWYSVGDDIRDLVFSDEGRRFDPSGGDTVAVSLQLQLLLSTQKYK